MFLGNWIDKEFASFRQQDSAEFFSQMLNLIDTHISREFLIKNTTVFVCSVYGTERRRTDTGYTLFIHIDHHGNNDLQSFINRSFLWDDRELHCNKCEKCTRHYLHDHYLESPPAIMMIQVNRYRMTGEPDQRIMIKNPDPVFIEDSIMNLSALCR